MVGSIQPRLPVLFIGHGNPMNAISDNAFTRTLAELGRRLQRPKTILCVSAHWMSEGTWITHMPRPKTIHDFYGFPKELLEVQYPAPGNPELADWLCSRIPKAKINLDNEMWGLDHGAWSVLNHMYPKADVPVLQLSLYMERTSDYHFKLGELLRFVREHGVLLVGSGNIVHNLTLMNWDEKAQPYPWAVDFDQWVKEKIEQRDFESLIRQAAESKAGRLSIPSFEHWYPLLYTLGASDARDQLRFEHEGIENSSISMRCLSFG